MDTHLKKKKEKNNPKHVKLLFCFKLVPLDLSTQSLVLCQCTMIYFLMKKKLR